MPLGYKYVQRDATDYVNWAEIGKNMSDMLQNENKIREEKKAAIDEDSRQLGITLSKYPQGQDANARTAALKLADDATQYKNMQLKLLKSGKLKLRDYLTNTQNLKDDITRAFDALDSYQKGYGETMDRYRNNESSIIEVNKWAKLDEIGGDWGGVQFAINPANGVLNLAKTKKKIIDGKEVTSISNDPNDIFSMNQIMGITKTKVDRLDAQKISDEWASKMGTYIKSDAAKSVAAGLWRQGRVVTIDDITRRADELKLSDGERQEIFNFYNAENQWIDSSLSNPYARGSVLMDHLQFVPGTNKMYRITHDKADAAANEEAIYEEINPSTQQGTLMFSDKQKKDSNDFMRNMTRPKYKYEEKVQNLGQIEKPRATTEAEYGREDLTKEAENFSRQTSYLLTGTPAQRADAVKYFKGKGANVIADPTGKDRGIYIEDAEGNMIPFSPSGKPLDQGKAIIGALKTATKTSIPDEMIIDKFPKFMGKQFSAYTGEIKGTVEPRDVEGEYKNKVVDKVRYTIFKKLDHKYAAPKLIEVIGNVPGVTVKPTGWNDLTITYTPKKGVPKSIKVNTNQSTDEEAKTNAALVKTFLQEIDTENKESAIGPETAQQPTGTPAPQEAKQRIKTY